MDINSNSSSDVGVLLISHGSRLHYGEDVINGIADIYREKTNYPIAVSYMNMSKPSIPTAINQLADEGVKKIVAIPVFLAHGVHTKEDIPRMLHINDGHKHSDDGHSHDQNHGHSHEDQDEKTEEIRFDGEIIYTEPLGADRRIVDIIAERVNDAL